MLWLQRDKGDHNSVSTVSGINQESQRSGQTGDEWHHAFRATAEWWIYEPKWTMATQKISRSDQKLLSLWTARTFCDKCPRRVTNLPTVAPSTNQNVSGETPPPKANNTDKNGVNSASNRQVKHSHTHRVTGMQGEWTLTGIVAGVEVDLLVDSGSDVTLLDPAVYNQRRTQA